MVMGIFWGMALLPRMAAQAAYDRAKWIGATGILSVGKENKRPAAAECSRLHGRGGPRCLTRAEGKRTERRLTLPAGPVHTAYPPLAAGPRRACLRSRFFRCGVCVKLRRSQGLRTPWGRKRDPIRAPRASCAPAAVQTAPGTADQESLAESGVSASFRLKAKLCTSSA